MNTITDITDKYKLAIIIPAYNEEMTIVEVIEDFWRSVNFAGSISASSSKKEVTHPSIEGRKMCVQDI